MALGSALAADGGELMGAEAELPTLVLTCKWAASPRCGTTNELSVPVGCGDCAAMAAAGTADGATGWMFSTSEMGRPLFQASLTASLMEKLPPIVGMAGASAAVEAVGAWGYVSVPVSVVSVGAAADVSSPTGTSGVSKDGSGARETENSSGRSSVVSELTSCSP